MYTWGLSVLFPKNRANVCSIKSLIVHDEKKFCFLEDYEQMVV